LRALLGLDAQPADIQLQVCGSTRFRNCEVLAVETNTARKVWAPAWLFLPKQAWTPLLLMVNPNGRNDAWDGGEMYDQLASAGMAVCALDVRGVGDLDAQFSPGAARYARPRQGEEAYAWASLILGHSLCGQRTSDILAFTEALTRAYPQAAIAVAARDRLTVPALCTAALDPRIRKLYLTRHLVSWRSVTEAENYFVPARQPGAGCSTGHRSAGDCALDRAARGDRCRCGGCRRPTAAARRSALRGLSRAAGVGCRDSRAHLE